MILKQDSIIFKSKTINNFVYEIESPTKKIDLAVFNQETYKPSNGISKISARLLKVKEELGLNIKFKKIQSKQLWKNLKMIDGDLPEIIGYSLLYRWLDRESSLLKIASLLEERDPLNFYFGEKSDQKFYEYKIKKFLAECAMGMTSEKPWDGMYDATGGVIIPKKDGEIVCFHIYDFNLFRQYLLNNTIFEQPSTGEDGDSPGNERISKGTKKYYYGWLYEDEEKLNFKINLQVRFK